MKIKTFKYFESVEEQPLKFEIGDKVKINGQVDGKNFSNNQDMIIDISQDSVITNKNEEGECPPYKYDGLVYYTVQSGWWISPHNLSKDDGIQPLIDTSGSMASKRNQYLLKPPRRIISKIDPYGEEDWNN